MGSDARRANSLKERIELLRKLERQAAAKDEPDVVLLAAIRELLMEAEAQLRE